MKLVENWDIILRRAWSARISILAAALTGLIAVWDVFLNVVPTGVYISMGIVLPVLVTLARLIDQDID